MKKFFLLLFLFLNQHLFAQLHPDQTWVDSINEDVKNKIHSLPPEIKVNFYLNGKLKKRGFTVCIFINDNEVACLSKSIEIFNLTKIPKCDSFYMICNYKNIRFNTRKFSWLNLQYGGRLTLGFVNNYKTLEKKFLTDPNSFKRKNVQNKLCEIFPSINNDISVKKKSNKLIYYMMIYNASNFSIPTYEFVK